MQKQENVVAFVGRSWIAYLGGIALSVLVIWTVPLLTVIDVLPMAPGPFMAAGLVAGIVIFGAWHLGFRRGLDVRDDGLVLSGMGRSRVVPWSELVDIEPKWDSQWVRCRDANGRVSLWVATSKPYPRMRRQISGHNEELATRLWYASR